jgi:ankyrin repeat protein
MLLDACPAAAEIKGKNGWTPLHMTLEKGANIDIIKMLLDPFLAAAEMKEKYGRTPLHLAIKFDRLEAAKYVISRGADPTIKENVYHIYLYWSHIKYILQGGKTPIEWSRSSESRSSLERILSSLWQDTTLHYCCHSNDIVTLRRLLTEAEHQHGSGSIDINAAVISRGSWTALHVASFMNRVDAAEMLIANGADLNLATSDNGGLTALHLASSRGHSDIVALLLRPAAVVEGEREGRRININAMALNGRTAVDYCAYYGHTSCLELLLAAGADPSLNGCKSLCYAVCRGHKATARLLIERGGPLANQVFYDHIIAGASSSLSACTTNRTAILIVAYNGFSECYLALLMADRKAAVEAEQPCWRGVERSK